MSRIPFTRFGPWQELCEGFKVKSEMFRAPFARVRTLIKQTNKVDI
jgi:hypothetical protein